ncbi:MAG: trypsin-like peptidase domain-containing protein, partial [Caldilineaceae bacterium]|nr:trypsin-like peptidase domain-containing protein [Caldilineaceae bacterium]MCB0141383.1 trypsin-like peptidase domain-containing protein [Caldilineaceae bacterium]
MAGNDNIERAVIEQTLPAVVQIVALRQKFMGNLSSAWTGSGTIVDPSGIILTNCHVANPRAMGMPAPPADKLAVAITERSDEPPVLTYIAEIVQQSPQMDLAVLQIVSRIDGKSV